MSSPLVSIVIPVYNVEQYVERCLLSCINQTYKKIEIIVINDESPDHSQNIIDKIAKTDNRISTYSHSNIGLGLTRNRGIELAKGDYIFFLDSDDFLPPDSIEKLVDQAYNIHFDIIVGNFYRIDCNGNKVINPELMECVIENTVATSINDRYYYFFSHEHILTNAWNKLYSIDFIKKNELRFSANNKIYAEDMLFNIKVFMCNPRIKIANIYTYFYFINNNSITNSYKANMALRWGNLVFECVEEMNMRNVLPKFENMISLICGIALSNISYNVLKFKDAEKLSHKQELLIFYNATKQYYNKRFIYNLRFVKNCSWSMYYRLLMKIFYSGNISFAAFIQSIRIRVSAK